MYACYALELQIIVVLFLPMGLVEVSDEFTSEFMPKARQANLQGMNWPVADEQMSMAIVNFSAGGS
jgi:hypothetical protein